MFWKKKSKDAKKQKEQIENFQKFEDEDIQQQGKFTQTMLPISQEQTLRQEPEKVNQQIEEDQNIQLDFTKCIVPEEIKQQEQEEQLKQIAEEEHEKGYKKGDKKKKKKKQKEQNDENQIPAFLTTKILLDDNGNNYYEEAAKEAKKINSTSYKLNNYVTTKAQNVKNHVRKSLSELDFKIKKTIMEKKSCINLWIAGKIDEQVVSLMSSMEPKITTAIKKSVPYDFMSEIANDTVIHLWKDFTNLIRLEFKMKIAPMKMEIRKRQSGTLHKIRCFVLYSLYPADLSTRDHMRRFSYNLMKALQFIPYYGLQPFVYLITFICINKDEEYQLVNYICDYKSIQFVTNGIFPCFIAYFHYFFFDTGPASHNNFLYFLLFTIFVQVVTVWMAYFLLRKSFSKAENIQSDLNIVTDDKGGRIKHFMVYDLITIILTMIISIIIYFVKFSQNNKGIGELVFFFRTFYALLNFPFMIFILPFFVSLLTNAIPTGYDKFGNCIPAISTLEVTYKDQPLQRTACADIEEIFQNEQEPPSPQKPSELQKTANFQNSQNKEKESKSNSPQKSGQSDKNQKSFFKTAV